MSMLRDHSICVMFVSYRQSRAHGVTVVAGHPVHAVRQVEGAPRPGRELGLLTSATNILYVRRKIFHASRKYFTHQENISYLAHASDTTVRPRDWGARARRRKRSMVADAWSASGHGHVTAVITSQFSLQAKSA